MPLIFGISKNSFKGQLPGEETIFVGRRHWFVLFFPCCVISFLGLLPFLLYLFIRNFTWFSIISSLFWFLVIIYFLILWLFFLYNIMLYILTIIIITNKRIIRIEQKALFNYERAGTELNKIQDISVKIEGIFATFLNFGDLEVQTAGTLGKFTFPKLPDPQKMKETIMSLPK